MWKKITYDAAEEAGDGARHNRMLQLSSTADYAHIKDWGRNTPEYAVFSSEVDRLGRSVPERYLDDRQDLKGTRLKLLCRLGSLPVMARVGREARPPWPREQRVCHMCNSPGTVEDVRHFVMECPAYSAFRTSLYARAEVLVKAASNKCTILDRDFSTLPDVDKFHIILGQRFGDKATEDKLDSCVKRYLRKCWNIRAPLTRAINEALGTSYEARREDED